MGERLTVLISAYACEPARGSEPGVGFNLCWALAKHVDIHVITRANNKPTIDAFLKRKPSRGIVFHYHDAPFFVQRIKRFAPPLLIVYYIVWQIGAYFLARSLSKRIRFDVVHHLTFGSVLLPTLMPLLGIPFFWGPLGGGETIPRSCVRQLSSSDRIKELLRKIALKSLPVNPFFLLACHRATKILVKTTHTLNCIPYSFKGKCIEIIDVGVYEEDIRQRDGRANGFSVLMVGSLETWRGFKMGIQGFAHAARKFGDIELVVVGTGKDSRRLQRVACDEGVVNNVRFLGSVTYKEYQRRLEDSTIVLNLTFKEGGVTFFFDALSYGKPVINLDITGSAQVNKSGTGICIELGTATRVAVEVGRAIELFYLSPRMRETCAYRASRILKEFHTWERKAAEVHEIYRLRMMRGKSVDARTGQDEGS